jgi:hypothetical protein
MMFGTNVQGVHLLCTVTHFARGCHMRVAGTGFGDADPPEPDEIEFYLKDVDGNLQDDLAALPETEAQILREYKQYRGLN